MNKFEEINDQTNKSLVRAQLEQGYIIAALANLDDFKDERKRKEARELLEERWKRITSV